jgi:hypothetical protein
MVGVRVVREVKRNALVLYSSEDSCTCHDNHFGDWIDVGSHRQHLHRPYIIIRSRLVIRSGRHSRHTLAYDQSHPSLNCNAHAKFTLNCNTHGNIKCSMMWTT